MIWFTVSINDGTGYMLVNDEGVMVGYFDLQGAPIEAQTGVHVLANEVATPAWYTPLSPPAAGGGGGA